MTDTDDQPRRTEARIERSRWPGWIWAVPIAAAAIVLWLAISAIASNGETVTVSFDAAHGLKGGDSEVLMRGVQVGKVSDVKLSKDGGHVVAKLSLDHDVDKYLRTGTRFWLLGATPSLSDPASLRGIIAGPQIVMEPGPGKPTREFKGLDRPPAPGAQGPQVRYVIHLKGAVGELDKGAPVLMRGFRVGSVVDTALRYDPSADALDTPVTIALEPARFGLNGQAGARPAMDAMLNNLVAQGLRARLAQDPPLIGQYEIELAFLPGAPKAALGGNGGPAVIPAAPSADLDSIAERADTVMSRIEALPIEQIGEHARHAAARVDALASSPALVASIRHLDSTLDEVDRTVHQVGPQVTPLVAKLRQAADQADQAAAAARRTVAGDPTRQDADLPSALHELSGAARSIRVLADYLERHPEALIKGKGKDKK
ncbi:MAG TPA: MlaD family protein [Sphingomonas sp.]|nr:MlaD family protein [Sphingomonas sp.]